MTLYAEMPAVKNQQSLLNRKINSSVHQITVYIDVNGEIMTVKINPEGLTTIAFILEAVDKFNQKHKLCLTEDVELYQLYAAKKNGKKQSDLPAMESQQLISKTNIKKFHLLYFGKLIQTIQTKQSISVIKSDFDIGTKKQQQKKQSPVESQQGGFFSCFCINREK